MSGPIRDLLALIGLACVVSTPIVLALLAMAGRRDEDDEDEGIVEVVYRYEFVYDQPIATVDRTPGSSDDAIRRLAARAKGGDE